MMLIKLDDPRCKPQRAHATDAGSDLVSTTTYHLAPGEQKMFDTGVALKIPPGFAGFVFNRSSQGKVGVQIVNGVGVIDADYRGTLKVILRNTGLAYYTIKEYETRIAQLVIVPIWNPEMAEYKGPEDMWLDTARGTGGFGSTGV